MMKLRYSLFFIIACFSLVWDVWPQTPGVWRYWGIDDGFDETNCAKVTVTPDGKVFVNHGDVPDMNILDGYSVLNIPNPYPHAKIFQNEFGQIWSISVNQEKVELVRYDHSLKNWIHFPVTDWAPTRSGYSWNYFPFDYDKVIYLNNNFVMEFDATSKSENVVVGPTDTVLKGFNYCKFNFLDKSLWICSQNGVMKLERLKEKTDPKWSWTEYPFPDYVHDLKYMNSKLTFNELNSNIIGIFVFQGTENSVLLRLQDNEWEILDFDVPNNTTDGWLDSDDRLWFITDNKVINIIQDGFRKEVKESEQLISGWIPDFETSTNDSVWFALKGGGLARYAPSTWRSPIEIPQAKSRYTMIDSDSKGNTYCANTENLIKLNKDSSIDIFPFSEEVTPTDSFVPKNLIVMFDKIYIGTMRENLYCFDPLNKITDTITHPTKKLGAIFPRNEKSMFIITTDKKSGLNALEIFDGINFHSVFNHNLLSNWPWIRDVVQTDNGDVWIGHSDKYGPILYREGKCTIFGPESGYTGLGAFSILDLGDGRIWCGARGGIYEFSGAKWKLFHSGLDTVRFMMRDHEGIIWVASGNGLHRYDKGSWSSINKKDGLPVSKVWNVHKNKLGNIYVATTANISIYHPESDPDPPETKIRNEHNINEFTSNGQTQFVYEARDKWKYTESTRLYYSHRVDDEQWSPFTSDIMVSIPGLSPGSHRFEVRAMDRNWNIDETPAMWDFTVLSPWYKEPTFFVIIIVCSLLIFFFAGSTLNRHFRLQTSYSDLRISHEQLKQTQNKLIQSEKMASLGQLVAGVAHEINNPVNFIKSNIQPLKDYLFGYKKAVDTVVAQKESLPEKVRNEFDSVYEEEDLEYANEDSDKLIQSFEDGSDRIARIVADLRLYSRCDEDYYSAFDIHEAIDSSLTLLHSRYKDQITIHKDYAGLPSVTCSPGKINQVFVNLLGNAIEANEESEGNVWITTSQEANNVIVNIRDDGKGIPSENLSKVFDPFFTTKPVGSGTGLGLSLSYGIIEQHGGTISVDSDIGKGTTFTVCLPIERKK